MFELGQVIQTTAIANARKKHPAFDLWCSVCFRKYINEDWGDVCEEDKKSNDFAVKNSERILASYKYNDEMTLWIITEWDRSATTLLFPEDY